MGKVGSNFTICSKILVNCQNVCTRNWSRNLFCEKWRGMQKSIWGAKSQKPQKTSFLRKTPKTGKNHENGGGRFGGRKSGFSRGGEKRRFSGVQNADFRVSQDFGTPRQNSYYLVCRHPPGGFRGRISCFSGFSGQAAKTPKIDSFGFSPKMSFFRFLRTGSDCVAY